MPDEEIIELRPRQRLDALNMGRRKFRRQLDDNAAMRRFDIERVFRIKIAPGGFGEIIGLRSASALGGLGLDQGGDTGIIDLAAIGFTRASRRRQPDCQGKGDAPSNEP